jgi:glutamine amidotransferase
VTEVVIVESGGANLASLQYALGRLGARVLVSRDPKRVASAARVILPGVGAAGDAMEKLTSSGLARTLSLLTQPVLGICLGMQLLFRTSEEGPTDCLNILPDTVRRIHGAPGRPVPHMGWNQVKPDWEDPLLEGIGSNDYAYFVHSYAVPVSDLTLAHTDYGQPMSAVVRHQNYCGTQFHPERSGKTGAKLLQNFLRL